MLAALSQAIEARDPYTRGHSARVTALADAVARRLGWRDERLAALQIGGALHDVGKLTIARRVLRKPGPLDADERVQIEAHPAAGAKLIESIGSVRPALPYVLFHHERWDGLGYPTRRSGSTIPIEARLLAIADAYDAMTSTRPYRSTLSAERALAELGRCAGTQFDPALVAIFLEVWSVGGVVAAS